MKTIIKRTNIEINSKDLRYIERRVSDLDKLIDKNDESVIARVEVEKTTNHHNTGEVFRAEINLHISGKDLRAESVKEDLHVAIDEVRNDIKRELRSYKNKKATLLKKGGRRIKEIVKGIVS